MRNSHLIFIACVFVFSSSWIVIDSHTNHFGFLWPSAGRFLIGSLVLHTLLRLKQPGSRLTWQQRGHLGLQSLLMYSLNFAAIYAAALYLPSGLNALVCAMVVFFNVINAKQSLDYKTPFGIVLGSLLGFVGLSITTLGNTQSDLHSASQISCGVALGLLGAFLTSMGQVRIARLKKQGLSPLAINAYGMLYGSLLTAVAALIYEGLPPLNLMSSTYFFSLLYIALVPTSLGFVMFTHLIQNWGPQKASYAFILSPVSALIISHFTGELPWKYSTSLGLVCVLGGYYLIHAHLPGLKVANSDLTIDLCTKR